MPSRDNLSPAVKIYRRHLCVRSSSASQKDYRLVISYLSVFTRTSLHYVRVFAIANPSVICNVHTPYSGGRNFPQYFFAILYLSHPLTFTEMVPGKPSVGGVKHKRGRKIERCRVQVSYLLVSVLFMILLQLLLNVQNTVAAV